ncbi:MafI family immunity protein [Lysinibacillus sp. NPDC093190]|uniref:MafI family immunity protein n=1 Tax=Lysinibacillus sp. NPDC093190 TaxID=3390575 RepID=UPI003D0442CF
MPSFYVSQANDTSRGTIQIIRTRLPQKDRITVLEYLEHREWGVALEHLCATICEENILISENVVHLIKDISQQMDIWDEIKEQIKDFI